MAQNESDSMAQLFETLRVSLDAHVSYDVPLVTSLRFPWLTNSLTA